MDYEKLHKDTIAKLQEMVNSGKITVETACGICADFAESEDERIRKGIIRNLEYLMDRAEGFVIDELKERIAWLDKQCKHSIYNVPSREVILAIWDLGNEWEELINGSISTEYGTQLDYIQKHWHESEYYLREKQGEQNDFDVKDYNSIDPHFGKPIDKIESTDNVEPKFNKGDWMVLYVTENIYQVVAVIDNYYQLKYGDNYTIQKCADVDRCARLWDITKDTKKGDVLSDGTTIFIFKDLLSDGSVMSYCDYDTDSGESDAFCPLPMNLMCSKITPATKEQRDLLFSKMKEAGYEWNAEKKELKIIDWSKHIKYEPNSPSITKEKRAWSEDDEKCLENAIMYCEWARDKAPDLPCYETSEKSIDWLKSLKQRIGGEQ